jgi:hypothetical protein
MTLLLAHTSNASPYYVNPLGSHDGDLRRLAKLMPQSDLTTPTGQLKYVVLGLGTQNYTCLGGNARDVPSAAGAVGT